MQDSDSQIEIAIIGAGGLAVTAAWELANSWRNDNLLIKIYDHDIIELSNLNRQILFSTEELGQNKAEILAKKLSLKFTDVVFNYSPFSIDNENIETELKSTYAVIDATDSVRTSFLLNDYCVKNLKIFSYAGVVAQYGQALLVNSSINSPCLRCIFGNWQEEDYRSIELTCQAAGIIGPIAGYLGWIQANSVIEAFSNCEQESAFLKVSLKSLLPQKIKAFPGLDCLNGCGTRNIKNINLTAKECPQTFILSKLALEQADQFSRLLINFKTKENAQKTMRSLKQEGKKVNWASGMSSIIACN